MEKIIYNNIYIWKKLIHVNNVLLDHIMIILVILILQVIIKYLFHKVVLDKLILMIATYFKLIDKEENKKLNNNFKK